jgi:rhodanese-related sulfurtransferase
MQTISREQLNERLANDELALVEVLGWGHYCDFHLPGAISVPWGGEFDQQIQRAVPEKDKMVVVYCLDTESQASSQAARRMDELGYQRVFDYVAGKMDWRGVGLPIEIHTQP